MHRLLRATIASTLLFVLVVPVVQAAKPGNTCGAEASGYFLVNRDIWWDITVAGIEAEGVDVYEADGTTFTAAFEQFAVDLGFADSVAVESFVRFFNGVDDVASSPLGDVDLGED